MNNIKTLEELFINDFLILKTKNESLESDVELLEAIEKRQNEVIESWKNKYNELVDRLKEDLDIVIHKTKEGNEEFKSVLFFSTSVFEKWNPKDYEYYKEVFDLKEEEKEEKKEEGEE